MALKKPLVLTNGKTKQIATFVGFGYASPAWNPYSAVELERTEFWEDTAGTLSLSDVCMEIWGTTTPPVETPPAV